MDWRRIGDKPLHGLLSIGPLGQRPWNFSKIIEHFYPRKCVWKCRLRNGSHLSRGRGVKHHSNMYDHGLDKVSFDHSHLYFIETIHIPWNMHVILLWFVLPLFYHLLWLVYLSFTHILLGCFTDAGNLMMPKHQPIKGSLQHSQNY